MAYVNPLLSYWITPVGHVTKTDFKKGAVDDNGKLELTETLGWRAISRWDRTATTPLG